MLLRVEFVTFFSIVTDKSHTIQQVRYLSGNDGINQEKTEGSDKYDAML